MRTLCYTLFLIVSPFLIQAQCDTASIYADTSHNQVCFDTVGNVLKCYSNNYPDHEDSYNSPFTVAASEEEYYMCLYPDTAEHFTPLYEETETSVGCTYTYAFGVSTNGVKYDPSSAEFFVDSSGADNIEWHVEARYIFSGSFGNNGGHLNPFGEYHYHDVPADYFADTLGITGNTHSPIVGYAADGFPIYYKYVYEDPTDTSSNIVAMSSGYSLKSGTRPGDGYTAPNGAYTGLYYEDYEYAADTLDSCNGRFGITPDYPNGTYYYVLTDNYPYIPRCFKGTVLDNSYRVGPAASCPASTASSSCDTASAFTAISGCTDPFSCNYNPSATVNDGSCYYAEYLDTTTTTACNHYMWHGMMFNASGTYFDTVGTGSCDSIATLILTINNTTLSSESVASCNSYTWQGSTYSSSGVYHDTIVNSVGCDSIMTLMLTISDTSVTHDTVSACGSYTWNGTAYNTSGTYSDTFSTSGSCDSIAFLELTIGTVTSDTVFESTCGSYTWAVNGTTYTTGGTYSATLTGSTGCDSVRTLELTINASNSDSETISACDSYTWPANSTSYTASGIYTTTLTNASGCDSVVTLNLTVNDSSTSSETITSCSAYTWNGSTYTSSGTYTLNTTNAAGCDSIATLILTINAGDTVTETVSACDSYTWPANSTNYTTAGTYTTTLTNASGCDSVVTLNLTLNSATNSSETVSACDSYTWPANSASYTTSGTHTTTLTNAFGCDSVVTLNLTINSSSSTTETISACDSYTWNGTTYSASGAYTYSTTNAAGCDSTATLNLSIHSSTTSSEPVTACDSYTWNSTVYSASGTYTYSTTNAAGCDSTATLILTINSSSTGSESVSACNSYLWSTNNTNYTTSGTYTATVTNSVGCDSVVTLSLNILASNTGAETVTACDTFLWPANGTVYMNSGTYTHTLTNSAGCDSVVTLNLTVHQHNGSNQMVMACDSYTWSVNNMTYTSSGNYPYLTTNSQGCDSLVMLMLTINQNSAATEIKEVCHPIVWHGQEYTQTGIYTDTIPNMAGCDSVVTLDLTITEIDNTVTVNGAELMANEGSATYQWLNCDQLNPVNGATAQFFTAQMNGSYAVELMKNNCTDTSECVPVSSIGIADVKGGLQGVIFPNPNNGTFTIMMEQVGDYRVEVYSATGQRVYQSQFRTTEHQALLEDVVPGVYIIYLETERFRTVKRMVVK